MSPTDKPVSVRLPGSQLRELMGLALVDGTNLAEQIRRAVTAYVEVRTKDASFQEQIRDARARQNSALDALLSR